MPYIETPLTQQMVAAVTAAWSLDLPRGDSNHRLHGGEESAAYRLGGYVVRVGPAWRSDAEIEWCHQVATAAAREVPEAIAPLPATDGRTVIRVEERPISVWPFVAGEWGDDEDEGQFEEAARLLGRVHAVLRDVLMPVRPPRSPIFGTVPGVEDAGLDDWLRRFDANASHLQPLHGDYYAGNTLVRDGHIVGLLDWDEAFIGPPARELAWAAFEWSDGLWAAEEGWIENAWAFVTLYRDAGGTAGELDEVALRQLVRERLRAELRYAAGAGSRGIELDDDDREYHDRQVEVFHRLRP